MNEYVYIIIFITAVFFASFAQIFLKKSAVKTYNSRIKEYLNVMVIGSYFVFFMSTFLNFFAYRGIPLSLGPILESTGFIYVTILSALFLKEKITIKKIIGNILIVLGIIIFYI